MVAVSDLGKVGSLNMELGTINQALDMIDAGDATIVNMTWARTQENPPVPPSDEPVRSVMQVTVSTREMSYPQAMVDGIKGFLTARAQEIRNELTALGLTGIELTRSEPPTRQRRTRPQ